MQPALATVSDLAVLMQTTFVDGSPEKAQAEMLLQMASAWARSTARKLWATVADIPEYRRDTVVGIILTAVRRELRNPSRAVYEVHGPDSASYSAASVPSGFFTDEELKYLIGSRASGSWFVMETYRDDPEVSAGYLYSVNSGRPIPFYAPGDTEGWENSYKP